MLERSDNANGQRSNEEEGVNSSNGKKVNWRRETYRLLQGKHVWN